MKPIIKTVFFPCLLSFTVLTSILYIYEQPAKLPFTAAAVFALNFVFFVLYEKLRLFNKKPVTFIAIVLTEALTVCVSRVLMDIHGYGSFREFNAWFFRTGDEILYYPSFIAGIIVLFAAFVSAAVFYFTVVRFNSVYLMMTCMVSFALYAKTFTAIPFIFPSLIIALFLFISIENRWYKTGAKNAMSYKKYLAAGACFVALSAYLAGLLPPAESTPYREKFDEFITGQSIAAIRIDISDPLNALDGDTSGGKPDESDADKVLFKLEGENPGFLRRQVFDNWDGEHWNFRNENSDYYSRDISPKENATDGAKTIKLMFATESKAVFLPAPESTINIKAGSTNADMHLNRSIRDEFYFSNGAYNRAGQTYLIDYYEDRYVKDDFWDEYYDGYLNSCLALGDYPQRDKVRELALSLTVGIYGDYEKAEALERYFYNGEFTYDAEFDPKSKAVGYFLFESKRGTCSDFATAMTVMAREAGLHARYVEGYAVEERDASYANGYIIRVKHAHAFPEVYADGSWVKFEPTIPGEAAGKNSGYFAILAALISAAVFAVLAIIFALVWLPRLKERRFRKKTLASPPENQVRAFYNRIYAVFMKKLRLENRLLSSRDLERLAFSEYGVHLGALTENYDRAVYGGLAPDGGDYYGIYARFSDAVKIREKQDKKSKKPGRRTRADSSV